MKKLIIILSLILVLTMHINIYAETSTNIDIKTQEEIIASILADNDFNEYLRSNGITQEELKEVLYSDYFANYVEYELTQIPDNEIIASWNILDWHIQKLENFINYIFKGEKDYRANNNNNNYDNYGYHRHNNMMPPPPHNNNWNNNWRQYPNNNNWNNNWNGYNNGNNNNNIINNNNNENICNCDCDNCKNCLKKCCN